MRRTVVMLALGAAVGVGTYFGHLHFRAPAGDRTLDHHLAWMQSELHVSDEQLVRLRALHEATEPQLRLLAAQVVQLQDELAGFEQSRRARAEVDFLALGRVIETRRNVYQECLDATRRLVLASADLMTPEQRRQYLARVAPTLAAESAKPL